MPLSSVLGAQSLVKPGVCTSSTRPASPFEGQTIYETDTDRLATWDGSAWIPYVRQTAGKVLQVVSATKTDTFTTTSTSFTDVTGLSAAITPSSTSNKILVIMDCKISSGADGFYPQLQIVRDSTAIYVGDASGSRARTTFGTTGTGSGGIIFQASGVYLDSPSTTSSTTYKVQLRRQSTSSSTAYLNQTPTDTDSAFFARTASSITVMEISG